MSTTAFEALSRRWLGIPLGLTARIVGLSLAAGAGMEFFMIKVWIGQTNFYETVKKKEAERRLAASSNGEPEAETQKFATILKEQWEEKKRELAAQEAAGKERQT